MSREAHVRFWESPGVRFPPGYSPAAVPAASAAAELRNPVGSLDTDAMGASDDSASGTDLRGTVGVHP